MWISRALISLALTASAVAQEPARDRAFGMVRTADGAPWVGATVHLLHRAHPGVLDPAYTDHLQTETDSRGGFKAQLLAGMPYAVWAQGPVDDGRFRCTPVIADVVPGVPIVLDEGEPHFVRRVALDPGPSWTEPVRLVARSTIGGLLQLEDLSPDDAGFVTTPAWPSASCSIQVVEAGRAVFATSVATCRTQAERYGLHRGVGADAVDDAAAAMRAPVRLVVPERTETAVRFVDDATGDPVAGVEVRAEGRPPRMVLGTTGADGVLRIVHTGDVSALPYQSVVLADAYAENEFEREDVEETPAGEMTEKRLAPGRPVRGSLSLTDGAPIANAPLVLQGSIWLGGGTTWFGVNPRLLATDADGRFVVPGRLKSHPFRLSAVLTPGQRARLSEPDAPPIWPLALIAPERHEEPEDLDDIRLDRLRSVDVTVRAPDGTPPGPVRLVVVPLLYDTGARSLPHEPDVVRTDRHGRIRVLVAPGTDLLVHTTTADGAAWQLVPADRTSAELTIDPAHVARFRVFDGEGAPVAGCSVSLVAPDSPIRRDGDDPRVHPRIRDLCMVHAFPRKSGRTDADGYVTLVVPTVDVALDLSLRHRERGLEGRLSVPFRRDREPGSIELIVTGKQ